MGTKPQGLEPTLFSQHRPATDMTLKELNALRKDYVTRIEEQRVKIKDHHDAITHEDEVYCQLLNRIHEIEKQLNGISESEITPKKKFALFRSKPKPLSKDSVEYSRLIKEKADLEQQRDEATKIIKDPNRFKHAHILEKELFHLRRDLNLILEAIDHHVPEDTDEEELSTEPATELTV